MNSRLKQSTHFDRNEAHFSIVSNDLFLLTMDSSEQIVQKLRFDAEDRLPPAYWSRVRQPTSEMCSSKKKTSEESKSGSFKKIDPEDWLKAPVFVPRSHQVLAETFGLADAMAFPEAGYSPDYPENTASEFSTTSLPENYWSPPSENFSKPNNVSLPTYPSSSAPLPSLMKIRTNPISTALPRHGQPPPSPSLYSVPPPPSANVPTFAHLPVSRPPFLPTTHPFSFLPRGYSANITSINSGIGPPIPAIVLKKKRKRRPRKYKDIERKSFDSPTSSIDRHPSDPNDTSYNMTVENSVQSPRAGSVDNVREPSARSLAIASSEPELNSKEFENSMDESALISSTSKTESNFIGGSCPDLSDDQLKIWDDILYRAVVADKEKNAKAQMAKLEQLANGHARSSVEKQIEEPEPIMRTSIYELCPSAVFDAIDMAVHADGINSKDLRRLDKQLAGKLFETLPNR
uniref:Uncharacterized protein n=1 Tax=Acrobeloides nanus TaxID=290746 RepID=A0A914CRN3_9BILA